MVIPIMKFVRSLLPVLAILLNFDFAFSEDKLLKLGAILPLTGGAAEYGVAVQNGFILAKETEPQLFKNIDIKFEDSKFDGKGAINAFSKLQTIDRVDIVYAWGAGPVQALVPVAERAKMPMIAATAEQAATKDKQYVLRFNYSSGTYAKRLLESLRSKHIKKIAIIAAEIPYYDLVISGMRESLKQDESVDVIASVPPSALDFKSEITLFSHKSKNYDALGVFLVTGQIATFYQQADSLNLSIPTFGTDFFESADEIAKSGSGIIGAVYPGMNISNDFQNRYSKRFGTDVQIAYAGSAYDAALLIARSFKSHTKEPLLGAIKKQSPLNGVAGVYTFNDATEGPGFDPELVIKEINKEGIKVLN